ncbi:MAG: class I SAM-dependent methyltransferase [Dongiaceae bacterium]
MAEARNSLHGFLVFPRIYRNLQSLLRKEGSADVVISNYMGPLAGRRILDVGCGPGTLLQFLDEVNYTGIDRNERYIIEAQARYGSRGRFILADVGEVAGMGFPPFDIVTMFGLLHHLDDGQAAGLFAAVRPLLREGGRVVTVDPCFVDRQNPIAWLLARMDRGRNVRRADAYRALAAAAFPKVELHVRSDLLRLPYDHAIMVCSA